MPNVTINYWESRGEAGVPSYDHISLETDKYCCSFHPDAKFVTKEDEARNLPVPDKKLVIDFLDVRSIDEALDFIVEEHRKKPLKYSPVEVKPQEYIEGYNSATLTMLLLKMGNLSEKMPEKFFRKHYTLENNEEENLQSALYVSVPIISLGAFFDFNKCSYELTPKKCIDLMSALQENRKGIFKSLFKASFPKLKEDKHEEKMSFEESLQMIINKMKNRADKIDSPKSKKNKASDKKAIFLRDLIHDLSKIKGEDQELIDNLLNTKVLPALNPASETYKTLNKLRTWYGQAGALVNKMGSDRKVAKTILILEELKTLLQDHRRPVMQPLKS